jgi:hypothetical protein
MTERQYLYPEHKCGFYVVYSWDSVEGVYEIDYREVFSLETDEEVSDVPLDLEKKIRRQIDKDIKELENSRDDEPYYPDYRDEEDWEG